MLLLICRKYGGQHGIVGFGVLDIYESGGGLYYAMHWNCLWMEMELLKWKTKMPMMSKRAEWRRFHLIKDFHPMLP